jgi:NAD(P)-dependent dehydrogenase (short-subunit alcohol dehydrogenase family)
VYGINTGTRSFIPGVAPEASGVRISTETTTKMAGVVPWIEPADVAPVVVFIASDAARMVSGATYDVTAGDSANNAA